ncbi:MAG: UDP-3-O-(3-hydroxymyristoyl)glucosamine N-acyltransferase [Bdellovibrionales bacterium]
MFTAQSLKDQFSELLVDAVGPLSNMIHLVSPVETPAASSLVFAQDEKTLLSALQSKATAIVTSLRWKDKVPANPQQIVFFSKNVGLAQAKLTQKIMGRYAPLDKALAGVHPTAVISPKTKVPTSCHIGPYVVIGAEVQLGENIVVSAHCVIEDRVKIGSNTKLWPHVVIAADCVVGSECVIHPHTTIGSEGYGFSHDEKGNHYRIPQIGNVVIEDRVELGSHCSIDRSTFGATRVGAGTVTDNYVHLAHNSTVGKNCVLAFGFGLAGSSHIGDNVMAGGRVSITDHVTLASGVRLGGVSVVTKDVTEPGDYGGYPLQKIKDYLKTTASLPSLPEMRKELARLSRLLEKDSK